MDVKGRTVLITGGGTGIGRSCAHKLAALGANVAVNYSRSASEAESLVADTYSILSNPVIFCSMIWVTLFSTVSAEAPG